MRTKLLLSLSFLFLSSLLFSQRAVHLNRILKSKPLYYETELIIIEVDYQDFLSEYESLINNTTYWDSEKQEGFIDDGELYKKELNALIDSLFLHHDTIVLNRIDSIKHFNTREHKMDYFFPYDEFESTLLKLLKQGKAKITDRSNDKEIEIISIKKKRRRHKLLVVQSAYWIVKDRKTKKEIFRKKIFARHYCL